jgi:hypothetical protein
LRRACGPEQVLRCPRFLDNRVNPALFVRLPLRRLPQSAAYKLRASIRACFSCLLVRV